jgi:transcriptional regulator with XRE-family HTH domain
MTDMADTSRPAESVGVGKRVRELRQRRHFSMRQLAKNAGVAVSYVAGVEAERISPTIATLRKLLSALDTDLGAFFAEAVPSAKCVFRRDEMRVAVDEKRRYMFVLPRRPDIQIEVLDEMISPGETPEFEVLNSDIAGYVLQGNLYVEIEGEERQLLQANDSFYVPAGKPIRGLCASETEPVRLLSIYSQTRY